MSDDPHQTVRTWIESHFGGTVTAIERQPRWRPVWFATVDVDGTARDLVVRGDRVDMELVFPLEHEMRFQQLVHEHGLLVPEVHGWIAGAGETADGPIDAYVMAAVPGEPYLLGASDADRRTVMREYMRFLSDLHQLPIEPFVEAGIVRADSPDRSGLVGLDRYIERYRRAKRFADPLLEFGLAWLERNPPDSKGREAAITWDSGQFHHANGHLATVLDLELGHIGDPMMDLAAFRMRDTIGGFGDFATLYAWYEEFRGEPVDLDAIKRHHFAFTLSNRLAFSSTLHDPPPGSDLMTNLQWCRETDLFATEALAEYYGIDLPTVDTPLPRGTRVAAASVQLVDTLRSVDIEDEFTRYEVRKAFRLARHVQRADEIADALDEADLDDLEVLLGHRPDGWRAGDNALEQFVVADDGTHDAELIVLFHKRNLRAQMVLGPAGSSMASHHRIQPFHA